MSQAQLLPRIPTAPRLTERNAGFIFAHHLGGGNRVKCFVLPGVGKNGEPSSIVVGNAPGTRLSSFGYAVFGPANAGGGGGLKFLRRFLRANFSVLED